MQEKLGVENAHPVTEEYIRRQIRRYQILKQAEQREEKPFLFYSRNVSWSGQPCKFCGSSTGIREVGGRYISAEMGKLPLIKMRGFQLR